MSYMKVMVWGSAWQTCWLRKEHKGSAVPTAGFVEVKCPRALTRVSLSFWFVSLMMRFAQGSRLAPYSDLKLAQYAPCAEHVRSSPGSPHVVQNPVSQGRASHDLVLHQEPREVAEWSSIALCTFLSKSLRNLAIRLTLMLLSLSSWLSESWSAAAAAGCSAALALGVSPSCPPCTPDWGAPICPRGLEPKWLQDIYIYIYMYILGQTMCYIRSYHAALHHTTLHDAYHPDYWLPMPTNRATHVSIHAPTNIR